MKKLFLMFLLIAITVLAFSDDIDEARELLLTERGGDILYLSRINLGIPGGDNWIADRSRGTYIYTINDEKEVRVIDAISTVELSEIRYWDINSQSYTLEYDIMQDIHGTRIGRRMDSFGDYNGDGVDEIFHIDTAIQLGCFVWGYDSNNGKELPYLEQSFFPISPKGPAPVVFANYQGTDGILIHTISVVETTKEDRYFWFFFVWDEENRKYVKQMEILADEIDWSMFTIVRNESSQIDSEHEAVETVDIVETEYKEEESVLEEISAFTPPDSGKKSGFNLYIVIITAIAVLAAATVFIVLKMKKK